MPGWMRGWGWRCVGRVVAWARVQGRVCRRLRAGHRPPGSSSASRRGVGRRRRGWRWARRRGWSRGQGWVCPGRAGAAEAVGCAVVVAGPAAADRHQKVRCPGRRRQAEPTQPPTSYHCPGRSHPRTRPRTTGPGAGAPHGSPSRSGPAPWRNRRSRRSRRSRCTHGPHPRRRTRTRTAVRLGPGHIPHGGHPAPGREVHAALEPVEAGHD